MTNIIDINYIIVIINGSTHHHVEMFAGGNNVKQVLCVLVAFGLIAWILLSNVSSVDYSYGKDYYSEYESEYDYDEKNEYYTQHENDVDPEDENYDDS